MIKTSHHLIRIIIFSFILVSFFNCNENKNSTLIKLLTNDSISLWDKKIYDSIYSDDGYYYYNRFESISFDINYDCELYYKTIDDNRIIKILGPMINKDGLCNKWEIINDTTIKLNCNEIFIVEIINRDTLILYDQNYIKKHELYRVIEDWNIDKESLIKKNEAIESEDYLSPIVW